MWHRWTRHWRLHRHAARPPREIQRSADSVAPPDAKPEAGSSPKSVGKSDEKPTKTKTKQFVGPMAKKPSPTKTRTGNALAQFVILSALTVVAYQFLAARLYSSDSDGAVNSLSLAGDGRPSPSPWTDAALEKHRAKHHHASDREAISTTEFSCFMACVGLFGLMQRKKKRSEEEAIEAQRRAVEMHILKERDDLGTAARRSTSDGGAAASGAVVAVSPSCQQSASGRQRTSPATLALLSSDVQAELLAFLSAEELVACAMVSRSWHDAAGDPAETLWRTVFARDFGDTSDQFAGIVPRICWRQYYFLHHLSRAVELARWLDATHQRKCVVIEGQVYDVTSFLDSHPGGYHVIGDVLGTDASDLWDQFQHSDEAKELMKEFVVHDAVLDALQRGSDKLLQRNLAAVENRWRQISWCLTHAHLLGGLSGAFLTLSFKFVVWRTTHTSTPRLCQLTA